MKETNSKIISRLTSFIMLVVLLANIGMDRVPPRVPNSVKITFIKKYPKIKNVEWSAMVGWKLCGQF